MKKTRLTGVTTIHLQPEEHDPYKLLYAFLIPDIIRRHHRGARAAPLCSSSATCVTQQAHISMYFIRILDQHKVAHKCEVKRKWYNGCKMLHFQFNLYETI